MEIDPLFDRAWVLRARYHLGIGDIPALVETLVNAIALAKEQVG